LGFLLALSSAPQAALGDYFQILYDTSTPVNEKFQADFGYAVYLEFQGKRVLMDTGTDAKVLANNVAAAGIDLTKLDAVIMTHNHHDHTGGLEWVRQQNPAVPVYVPPGQRYPVTATTVVEQSMSLAKDALVIRGHTDVPTAGISDDLSIALRTGQGLFVISSCSHSGVAGIVDRAQQAFGGKVAYFSGGARLIFRDPQDADEVARALAERGVHQVSPSHCSLSHAVTERMRGVLGERMVASRLGAKIALPQ